MSGKRHRPYSPETYKDRLEKGVCVFHPSIKINSGTYCDKCKADRLKTELGLKKRGVCTQCRKQKAKKDCTLCPKCLDKASSSVQPYRKRCMEVNPEWGTIRGWRADKLAHCLVLARLGGKCVCCGEIHPLFLSVDHIDGGGSKHRKKVGSKQFIRNLVKEKDLGAYQVLCIICNWGRQRNRGICPHKTSPKLTVESMISNLQKIGYTNATWDNLLYM
jgi:hypothetical protein